MIVEQKVPSPGESISEVVIARWLKKDGDYVEKDDELCEIDSDKATLTVNADEAGAFKALAAEGDTVTVGSVICTVDTAAAKPAATEKAEEPKPKAEEKTLAHLLKVKVELFFNILLQLLVKRVAVHDAVPSYFRELGH
jgi:2-oxoglutarate dehydrogenase E2 component (dihydrolipoamide succinyltransferase)